MEIYKLYNKKITLTFDPKLHIYKVGDKVVNGVTSVINVIDKPFLIYWAVNQAVDYLRDNLRAGKSYDEIEIGNLLNSAKVAHRQKSQEAADIGTLFHEWADKYIQAKINKEETPKPPINKKLKSAVDSFLDWEKKNKVKWIESERKVYSRKYNYAGTFDALAEVNKKLCIIDFKTSKGIYDEYFLQTAAYAFALEEETKQKADKNLIIRVSKQGGDFEVKDTENLEYNFKAFLACLGIFRWQKENKKADLLKK